MTTNGTPSWAISIACACLSWCGAKRREHQRVRRSVGVACERQKAPSVSGGRAVDYAEKSPDGEIASDLEPWLQLIPGPAVHPDLAALPALAPPNQHRTAQTVEIRFGKVECLADPEPGAPQHHDQGTQPCTVWTVAGGAHDGDDLLDRGRIGRVAEALVARGSPLVIAGHRGRRAAMTGSIQQHRFHVLSSLGC
jgi:hypothetical protein